MLSTSLNLDFEFSDSTYPMLARLSHCIDEDPSESKGPTFKNSNKILANFLLNKLYQIRTTNNN